MFSNKGRVIGMFIAVALPLIFLLIFMPKEKREVYLPLRQFPVGLDTTYNDAGEIESIDTMYHKIPEWVLTSHLGEEFNSKELEGQVYIVDFFFTRCPGQCRLMTKQMSRVQKELMRDDGFKLVSITIDPKRDSVQQLREYAKENGAIPGKWWFMTGHKEHIYSLAKDGYMLTAQDTEDPDVGEDGFIHSDRFILVDAQRHIRGFYRGTDSLSVNKCLADAVLLLRQAKEQAKDGG